MGGIPGLTQHASGGHPRNARLLLTCTLASQTSAHFFSTGPEHTHAHALVHLHERAHIDTRARPSRR